MESFLLSPIFHPHSKEWPSLTLLHLLNIYKTYPLLSILIVVGYTLSYSHWKLCHKWFCSPPSSSLQNHHLHCSNRICSKLCHFSSKILSIPLIAERIEVKFLGYCFRKYLENTVFWVLLIRRDIMDWPPTTLNMVVI